MDIDTYKYDRDTDAFHCVEFAAGQSFKTRMCLEPMEVKEKHWREDAHLGRTQPQIISSP